jgi:hemolysin activation/secretion protein
VSVVRFRQDFLYRDLQQVIAARSQLSVGLDVLGATMDGCVTLVLAEGCASDDEADAADVDGVPDAQFLSWLGQFQWVRRFEPWGLETVFRTDLQVSNRPLFSLEQFPVGGHQSVRGYRENELVRDNGLASSLELRIPLWSNAAETSSLQLAPFFDVGYSWNTQRGEPSPRTLSSAGIGLRAAFTRHLSGELYWGHRIRWVPEPADHDMQDDGVQFSLVASF